MGLYDNYNAINSTGVRQYQGSAVPEMVAVSNELQKRYDTSQNNIDYANQYLNNLSALPQDQAALKDLRDQYTGKLGEIGKRADLENATRETTRLAQQLPQDYAGFAQRQKDYSDAKAYYDKKVEEGKLVPEEAQALLERDVHADRGIQKDPATQRYTGRFSRQDSTDTFDTRKAVDDYMEKQFPSTQGWTKESGYGVDGQKWIFKNGSKTVVMDANRIKNIIASGFTADPHASAWINQQKNLGTYKIDYSKISPEDMAKLPQSIKDKIAKGENLTGIAKSMAGDAVHSNILNNAYNYAVSKYQRNDRETTSEVRESPYTLKTYNGEQPFFDYTGASIGLSSIPSNYKDANVSSSKLSSEIQANEALVNDPKTPEANRLQAVSKLASLKIQNSMVAANNKAADDYAMNKLSATDRAEHDRLAKLAGGYRSLNDIPTDVRKKLVAQIAPTFKPGSAGRGLLNPDQQLGAYVNQYNNFMSKVDDHRDEWYKDKSHLQTSYSPRIANISDDSPTHKALQSTLNNGNPAITIIGPNGQPVTDPVDISRIATKGKLGGSAIDGSGLHELTMDEYDAKKKPDGLNGKYFVKFLNANDNNVTAEHLMNMKHNADAVNAGAKMKTDIYQGKLREIANTSGGTIPIQVMKGNSVKDIPIEVKIERSTKPTTEGGTVSYDAFNLYKDGKPIVNPKTGQPASFTNQQDASLFLTYLDHLYHGR